MIGFLGYTGSLFLEIKIKSLTKGALKTNKDLVLGKWTHVSVVLNRGLAKIYYDSVEVASGTQNTPINITRRLNYIGKSGSDFDRQADITLDEIKIYEVALNQTEIEAEFKREKTTTKIPNLGFIFILIDVRLNRLTYLLNLLSIMVFIGSIGHRCYDYNRHLYFKTKKSRNHTAKSAINKPK